MYKFLFFLPNSFYTEKRTLPANYPAENAPFRYQGVTYYVQTYQAENPPLRMKAT